MDRNGNIVVADCFNDRVMVFDSSGQLVTEFGSPQSGHELSWPRGLATTKEGRVIVTEGLGSRVSVWS